MVSRWLPYLRGTVLTTARASLDKGRSLSYDMTVPFPRDSATLPLSLSFCFILFFHPSPSLVLLYYTNIIWHHLSSRIHIQHLFMSNHVLWRNTHSSKRLPSKWLRTYSHSSTFRGFKVREQALESISDLMLLTDQTDSRRKWKLCKPREHL